MPENTLRISPRGWAIASLTCGICCAYPFLRNREDNSAGAPVEIQQAATPASDTPITNRGVVSIGPSVAPTFSMETPKRLPPLPEWAKQQSELDRLIANGPDAEVTLEKIPPTPNASVPYLPTSVHSNTASRSTAPPAFESLGHDRIQNQSLVSTPLGSPFDHPVTNHSNQNEHRSVSIRDLSSSPFERSLSNSSTVAQEPADPTPNLLSNNPSGGWYAESTPIHQRMQASRGSAPPKTLQRAQAVQKNHARPNQTKLAATHNLQPPGPQPGHNVQPAQLRSTKRNFVYQPGYRPEQ